MMLARAICYWGDWRRSEHGHGFAATSERRFDMPLPLPLWASHIFGAGSMASTRWHFTLCGLFGLWATIVGTRYVGDSDSPDASAQSPQDGRKTDDSLTVHEWGTFTTFSGSDGLFLEFRPLDVDHEDLPDFVGHRLDPLPSPFSRLLSKRLTRGRVRMETPVTYFYTDRVRQVTVRVDFPDGLLTEFYPPVREVLPPVDVAAAHGEGEPIGNSSLDWGTVTLIPTRQLVAGISDRQLQEDIAHTIANAVLPTGARDTHYAQARATDSALVYWNGTAMGQAPVTGKRVGHLEKFLFYRGIGRFELPIQVDMPSADLFQITNNGTEPFRSAIWMEVKNEMLKMACIDVVKPGQTVVFPAPMSTNVHELASVLEGRLLAEGLYAKEAAAMVATWRDSWFREEGTRVLCMVPQSLTDALLPLHINPPPQSVLRVLVGRLELLPPAAEQRLAAAVARSLQARMELAALTPPNDSESADNKVEIPEEIRALGRMAEPALTRIKGLSSDVAIQEEASLLIGQLRRAR